MEGIAAAADRVQTIERRLASLRAGAAPPGAAFAQALQTASAPAASRPPVAGTAPGTATAPVPGAAPAGSAAWTAAVQRPASLAAPVTGPVRNGQLPDSALVGIGGQDRLQPQAAEGFLRMRAAAEAAGVRFEVNDSYRTLEEQQHLARTKGLYSEGGLAAKPGTSNHGLGLSVDLQLDDEAQRWMRANGARFGFVEDVPREPWHWTFTPS